MRRSAAPSSQSAAKRLRFLSPFLNSPIDIEENDIFNMQKIKPENSVSAPVSSKHEDVTSTTSESSTSSSSRSTEEILKILFEPTSEADTSANLENDTDISAISPRNTYDLGAKTKPLPSIAKPTIIGDKCDVKSSAKSQDVDTVAPDPNIRYYNVLWCKRSAKKHKVWEGDGILIVKTRSAILKDTSGKIIDRGIGYKLKEIEEIEDGGKFFIGGKECEIQYEMSPEEYKSLENCDSPEKEVSVTPSISKKTNLCM